MSRKRATAQVNQFIGGFNTEANPINFPANFTSDELNIELNANGSRSQRLGFDVEGSFTSVDTSVIPQAGQKMGRSQFRWTNPGGLLSRQILVVQLGTYIGFHEITGEAISQETLYSTTVDTSTYENNYSFSVVDGVLVAATGEKSIRVFEFDGTSITESSKNLLIRDFFGVEDNYSGVGDLLDRGNLQVRPNSLTLEHIYNLRNQTFGLPRPIDKDRDSDEDFYEDSISRFEFMHEKAPGFSSTSTFPSNADNLSQYMYAHTDYDDGSKTLERFSAQDMIRSPPGSTRAPTGYFIIDALERGSSRTSELRKLEEEYSQLEQVMAGDLGTDTTPQGARVLTQYAGRIWYAGFSSEVVGGDAHSPKMSSYLLFSQIVRSPDDAIACYQDADPTSHKDPDLTAADGGYLKVDGAYGIKSIVPLADSLFVFAENGVWRVYGIEGATFSATSYGVSKVSNLGCESGTSVVEYGGGAFYWGQEGIYRVAKNPTTATWEIQDITADSIKSFYEDITDEERASVVSYYDYRSYSVRWLYGVSAEDGTDAKELILNTKFSAFTRNTIPNGGFSVGPTSVSGGQSITNLGGIPVTVGLEEVTVGGEGVTVPFTNLTIFPSNSFYCILLSYSPTIEYTFGGYSAGEYRDWGSLDIDGGVWPEAYLVTGPVSAPDPALRKDVPYLMLHFPYRQEDASCLYSGRWGWSNSIDSGRWSVPREGYRLGVRDDYKDVVTTKNLVRGRGPAVSFKFESNGTTPIHLLGWSYGVGVTERA